MRIDTIKKYVKSYIFIDKQNFAFYIKITI